MQSVVMELNQAEEHLQTIRTLMERSAVYRRALAPIMVWNGCVGVVAGLAGWKLGFKSERFFVEYWGATAVLAIVGSFLLVRRQALKDAEPFWSPPTRRVAQALLPPLAIGCFFGTILGFVDQGNDIEPLICIIALWLLLYGCAAHAAGFFMTRGMKLFGWVFILFGCFLFLLFVNGAASFSPHLLMGFFFGGLHLAYGVYLYLTEKGKNAA
jgi:hypothetical protein